MADVLSIIGSVLAILTAADGAYQQIQDIRRLPQAFEATKNKLPLVLETLRQLKEKSVPPNASTSELEVLMAAINTCKEKAETLKAMLEKLVLESSAPPTERYLNLVKKWGKKSLVEELMKDIVKELHVLACHQIMKLATAEQLEKAMQDLEKIPPSDAQADNRVGNTTYGDINQQTNNFGTQSHTGSGHFISGPANFNYNSPPPG